MKSAAGVTSVLAIILGALLAFNASAQAQTDLRQFSVGMSLRDLPQAGYTDFACANAPDIKLQGWRGYQQCPKDALGLHPVSFRYEDSANPLAQLTEQVHGTRVGGHPVLLSLLFGDDGDVRGLHIATDPKARLYLRKKAFLLANQVRARYGNEGWQCQDAKPHGNEEPIGGVFIDRTCRKETTAREVSFVQELFRRAGEPIADFTSATEVTVLARK